MTASISIPVSAADNVLTVPLAAVFTEQGERYVLVKTGDTVERRPVVVGVSDFFKAEIKSGLGEGDVVSFEQPGTLAGTRTPGGGPPGSTPVGTGRPVGTTVATTTAATTTPRPTVAGATATTATAAGGAARPATTSSRPGT